MDDLTSETPVMEIMLNMQDYEIESGSVHQHKIYNYGKDSNNNLSKGADYIVYAMTIVPKKELIERHNRMQQSSFQEKGISLN